ncbi:hypothetical protein GGF41_005838, partial [Coemansia sp. RSA 2531]
MKLLDWRVSYSSTGIRVEYIGEGGDRISHYEIERDIVTDLDSLLSEERNAAIYSFVSTTDNLVRIQYDVSFQWAG